MTTNARFAIATIALCLAPLGAPLCVGGADGVGAAARMIGIGDQELAVDSDILRDAAAPDARRVEACAGRQARDRPGDDPAFKGQGRVEVAKQVVRVLDPRREAQEVRRAALARYLSLRPGLDRGDFLLNLSVDVSSVALIELCQEIGALYLDTCIEPWPGGYTDPSLSMSQRTNYALRETARALRRPGQGDPTALVAHGANPGMVSHFVKQALVNLADALGWPLMYVQALAAGARPEPSR